MKNLKSFVRSLGLMNISLLLLTTLYLIDTFIIRFSLVILFSVFVGGAALYFIFKYGTRLFGNIGAGRTEDSAQFCRYSLVLGNHNESYLIPFQEPYLIDEKSYHLSKVFLDQLHKTAVQSGHDIKILKSPGSSTPVKKVSDFGLSSLEYQQFIGKDFISFN